MWCERTNHYYRRLEEWFLSAKILDVGCGAKKFPGAVGIDVRCNSLADI